jgi:hypothetical protein
LWHYHPVAHVLFLSTYTCAKPSRIYGKFCLHFGGTWNSLGSTANWIFILQACAKLSRIYHKWGLHLEGMWSSRGLTANGVFILACKVLEDLQQIGSSSCRHVKCSRTLQKIRSSSFRNVKLSRIYRKLGLHLAGMWSPKGSTANWVFILQECEAL